MTEFGPKDISIVIAGNKEDLVQNEAVTPDEATAFAKSIGAIYKKTSAKTNVGVEQMFRDLASKMFPDVDSYAPKHRSTVVVNKETEKNAKTKKGCC